MSTLRPRVSDRKGCNAVGPPDALRLQKFPAAGVHPHASARRVRGIGGRAGHFWEMHDALFEHQYALENST